MEREYRLKVTDLADILATPFDRESSESGYRSGYRDGWIVCIDALAEVLTDDDYEKACRFWQNALRAWVMHFTRDDEPKDEENPL